MADNSAALPHFWPILDAMPIALLYKEHSRSRILANQAALTLLQRDPGLVELSLADIQHLPLYSPDNHSPYDLLHNPLLLALSGTALQLPVILGNNPGQPLLLHSKLITLSFTLHSSVLISLQSMHGQKFIADTTGALSEDITELEEALAEFTGRPRALLFSTGYMANLGAVTALVGQGDSVLEDRLNHASLLDAGLLSGARFSRYLHNDGVSLANRLRKVIGNTLIVTDGVFSMDGDLADLPSLCAEARRANAWVMVDDAHGFGPLGATGGGIVEHFGLGLDDVQVLVGTLGKAFGTAGAFVAGSDDLIEALVQFARPYIYTTSQPPALACATLQSLELLRSEHWRREHLNALIKRFREGAQAIGLELMDSATPIQPILIGDSGRAMQLSQMLRERGLLVTAIRPPTVPAGSARLRVTLSAAHSLEQLELLLEALAECWPLLAGEAAVHA